MSKQFTIPGILSSRAKGGVLQLTLGIALVIAVICSSIVLLAYYSRLTILNSQIRNTLRDNARSGIEYINANRTDLSFFQSHQIDLFELGTDSVELVRRPWGLFEMFTANAFRGQIRFSKTALMTRSFAGQNVSSLYVPDNNASIYLAGKSDVRGTIYVSERKLTPGYAGGRGFEGKNFPEVDYKTSAKEMPVLDTLLLHFIRQLSNREGFMPVKTYIHNLSNQSNFSFSQNVINIYYREEQITLRDSLAGNIVICSGTAVTILEAGHLEGAIIIAPTITVEEGFTGSVQLFSTHSILIGQNVNLTYPSSLVLMGQASDSIIHLRRGTRVEGLTVIQGYSQQQESAGIFRLDAGALFHGAAYINGSSDIQGEVRGHLTTKRVHASVDGQFYGNHILDGKLNFDLKSPYMPASLLWGTGPSILAKWIE